jgi:hypothetical protein
MARVDATDRQCCASEADQTGPSHASVLGSGNLAGERNLGHTCALTREERSPTFSDGALKLRLNESYMGEDEVCFLELQSEEQPDMNGWYWTDQPGISDEPAGVVDVEGIHGPFKTKQEALDHYNFRRLQ